MLKKIWVILLFLTSHLYLQNLFFDNLSYVENFTFLKPLDSTHVMVGSTGGVILFNSYDYSYRIYNYTQGFPSAYITCAEKIDEQKLVLGSFDGRLIIFDLSEEKVLSSNADLIGENITGIFIKSDTVWITTENKIAVFFLSGEDELKFIDSFANYPVSNVSFFKIFLIDSRVYAVSSDAIFFAPNDIQTFNLKAESVWQIVRDSTGVSLSSIKDALSINNDLLILTDNGVYTLFNNENIAHFLKSVSADHFRWNGELIFAKNREIFNDSQSWNVPEQVKDFTVLASGILVMAPSQHLYFLKDSEPDTIRIYSFPMDRAGEIIKTSNGTYFTNGSPPPFFVNNGLVSWNDSEMIHFYWDNNVWMNRTRFVKEILPGVVLTGTWGAGFWIYDENNRSVKVMNNFDSTSTYNLTMTHFSMNNQITTEKISFKQVERLPSVLSEGIGFESQHLVFIADAAIDSIHGYLWILQYIPGNSRNLVGFRLEGNSIDFSPENAIQISVPGISQNAIYAITIDLWGGIWLGTPFNGLIYVDLDAYFAGQNYVTRFMEADGLASNNVLSLAADQEGYVLIGTAAGTNVWTGSQLLKLREDYQPIGLRINSIVVDELGNRWFATESGISLLKQGFVPWNTEGWVHFAGYSANVNRRDVIRTNIPESDFYGIFADYQSQRIFLSSDNGLFISNHFPGLASARSSSPLIAFPNPAITGNQNTSIKIKNILPNSVVKVLTVNGKLVRELNPDRKDEFSAFWAVWDGRDENGALVPTGVYIVYSISDNGESQIGKIFLIQK